MPDAQLAERSVRTSKTECCLFALYRCEPSLHPKSEQLLNMPLARDPSDHSRTISFQVFAALTTPVALACWSVDGFEESNRLVCDPQAEVSSCRSLSEICYSNGLCGALQEAHNDTLITSFYINACTQQDFDDPKCRENNSDSACSEYLPPPHTIRSVLQTG